MGRSMVTKESDYGQQYKEYTTQAAGNKAYIVGAQVLGGELWFNYAQFHNPFARQPQCCLFFL